MILSLMHKVCKSATLQVPPKGALHAWGVPEGMACTPYGWDPVLQPKFQAAQ